MSQDSERGFWDSLAAKYKISELSATVLQDGRTFNYGDLHSRYPVYSITKTFIAVLLLKLAYLRNIDLDDPFDRIIADAPEANRYSLRHLLNNTSGVPDYYTVDQYRSDVMSRPGQPWTRDEYIDNTYKGQLLFAPGQNWMYSNLGFMFLREAIEKINDSSFYEALRSHIFSPMELGSCRVLQESKDLLNLVPAQSVFISQDGKAKEVRGTYHPGWVAHGVIAANSFDVAQFYQKLFAGKVLDTNQFSQLISLVRVPGEHPPAVSPSYGLGIMGDPDAKFGSTFGHGGGGPGYAHLTTHNPSFKGGTTVAVLSNAELAPIPLLMQDVFAHLAENA